MSYSYPDARSILSSRSRVNSILERYTRAEQIPGRFNAYAAKQLYVDFQNVFDSGIKLNELYTAVDNVLHKNFLFMTDKL